MGSRFLRVSPEFLVEFLKQREDWPRAYTVSPALPDDTRLLSCGADPWSPTKERPTISLWLESAAWAGDGGELRDPVITVHLLDPVALEAATRKLPGVQRNSSAK